MAENEKDFEKLLKDALISIDTLTADGVTLKADNERLTAKISEANKHTKKAEQDATDALKKKAEKDGDYKQLLESSLEENKILQDGIDSRDASTAKGEIRNAAMKVAAILSDGHNIELMSEQVEKRLQYHDESVKVTDEKGGLTIHSLEELGKELSGSARYASLLKGNKSSGGGAPPGGSNNGSAAKTITRTEFNALSPVAKSEYLIKDSRQTGNTVVDD